MAQVIQFQAASGLTLTAKLYSDGTLAALATASSVTEQLPDDPGTYLASFTTGSVVSGRYRLVWYLSGTALGYQYVRVDATNGLWYDESSLIASVLNGITSMANWLRALARSDASVDATALSEINNGAGDYKAKHSLEGIRRKQGGAGT